MGRSITDEDVSALNEQIAWAPTTRAAFALINGATRTMLARLLDLNGEDADMTGLGHNGRVVMGQAHGWVWAEQDDDRPADGHGPCENGFSAHSRRPLECRNCGRRRIDHRPLSWVRGVAERLAAVG